jgi:hypothetical protein
MTDAPKHSTEPDPANELASDSSSIDPRDFRNHHHHRRRA